MNSLIIPTDLSLGSKQKSASKLVVKRGLEVL